MCCLTWRNPIYDETHCIISSKSLENLMKPHMNIWKSHELSQEILKFPMVPTVLSQLPMKILPVPRLPQQLLHLLRPLQLRGTGIGLRGRRDRQPRPRQGLGGHEHLGETGISTKKPWGKLGKTEETIWNMSKIGFRRQRLEIIVVSLEWKKRDFMSKTAEINSRHKNGSTSMVVDRKL